MVDYSSLFRLAPYQVQMPDAGLYRPLADIGNTITQNREFAQTQALREKALQDAADERALDNARADRALGLTEAKFRAERGDVAAQLRERENINRSLGIGGSPQAGGQSVPASWYSQYSGASNWVDRQDRPNSNALGVPDDRQGIARPSRATLGQWFDVTGPDGKTHRLQQTDIGPAKWTGKGVDISAAAADRMGYTPQTFPTGARFSVRPASGPPDAQQIAPSSQSAPGAPAGLATVDEAKAAQLEGVITNPNASAGQVKLATYKLEQIRKKQDAAEVGPNFKLEQELRKEVEQVTKPLIEVRRAYSRVLGSENNAAGDISLIFGFMKMLDPQSVVREGEQATAQNAAGIPDRIRNVYNRIMTGERLTPGQRAEFKGQSKGLYTTAKREYKARENQYRKLSDSYGFDPSRILPDIGPEPGEEGAVSGGDAVARAQPTPSASFDERFMASYGMPGSAGPRGGPPGPSPAPQAGPQQSTGSQIATDFLNVGPAATQRTNPNVGRYNGQLVSDQTFESDSGEVMYRDPASGQVVPTNTATQVAIRDPADGRVKVFNRTEATNEIAPVAGARVLTQGLGAGAPTARPGIPVPSAVNATPRASDVFATAKAPYREFKDIASKIPVSEADAGAYAGRIRDALKEANLTQDLAGPVFNAVNDLESGAAPTLDQLQNVRRVIDRSLASPDKNVRDAANVARRQIGQIISEVSPEAGQAYATANEIQSTAYAVQDLQRKGAIAGLRAGRAGYGGNAPNTMRQVLSPIVQKSIEGRTTSFRPNEIAAIRDIVEGTPGTNAARMIGQFSPSKGAIQTLGAGGAAMVEPTLGATMAGAGFAANKLATFLTGRQIDKLKTIVAKRSPAYQQAVDRAVERWTKTQGEFVTRPSKGNLAKFVAASRTLSSGLTRDGISVSSGDLLRSLQGPVRGAAEDEQP